MILILVLPLNYSMILTHFFLFYVSNPEILWLLWFRPQGINLFLSVVAWWRRRWVISWVHSWPVTIFGTLPCDSVILGCIMCFCGVSGWWDAEQVEPGLICITSSCWWDKWYWWGRYRHEPTSTKGALKANLQDEKEKRVTPLISLTHFS